MDYPKRISDIEIQLLEGIEQKDDISKIANSLKYSETEVENILILLLNRFQVTSNDELIKFAYLNHILPNQFKAFLPN